jgi:hypothetical protein
VPLIDVKKVVTTPDNRRCPTPTDRLHIGFT